MADFNHNIGLHYSDEQKLKDLEDDLEVLIGLESLHTKLKDKDLSDNKEMKKHIGWAITQYEERIKKFMGQAYLDSRTTKQKIGDKE